jgi:hypothetical protein
MTRAAFEHGYWYATELKTFAQTLGLADAAKLRKDELEKAILAYLATGKVATPTKRSLLAAKKGTRDFEKGLRLDMPVVRYTSNRETKDFLVREALKMAPGLKRRSGARYRLNRWREEQLTAGERITYRDLVAKYVELNAGDAPFARIPHGRYINFVADFLAGEAGATRQAAVRAWKELKALDVPKTYRAWRDAKRGEKKPRLATRSGAKRAEKPRLATRSGASRGATRSRP